MKLELSIPSGKIEPHVLAVKDVYVNTGLHDCQAYNAVTNDYAYVRLTTDQLKDFHHQLGEYLAKTETSGTGQS